MERIKIYLIFLPTAGELIRRLATKHHVWAILSDENEQAVLSILEDERRPTSDPSGCSLTIFDPQDDVGDELITNTLEIVEQHYDEDYSSLSFSSIDMLGIEFSVHNRILLQDLGYSVVSEIEGGMRVEA
ncbi:MAG: hypothetical protein GY930_20875 [bacterium]|nr:hypothetical protein [bacterium]